MRLVPQSPHARRRIGVVVLLLVVLLPAVPTGAVTYQWPVPGPVVRPFEAPAVLYGPGHRGVDLRVRSGDDVRPMAAGQVLWAGTVVGRRWVTVQHADGIRTSYGPLGRLLVATGDRVTHASVIGTADGAYHGVFDVVHVGARRGDAYIDPALLLAPDLVPTLLGAGQVGATAPDWPERPTLVDGAAPSTRHLIVLAGLTSQTGHLPLDPTVLGYDADQWTQFSYTGVTVDGQPREYSPQDTWQRVHDAALALRDQLRAHWVANPGVPVDLVGHSLGGLVAMYYLLVLHDPYDPTLPPIGKVATLASPLEGADAATVMQALQDDPIAHALLELIAATQPGLDDDAPVLTDLAPGSDVTRALREAWERHLADPYAGPLANGTDVLTVGGLFDPVVPEWRSDLPGADHETVYDEHSGTPRNDRTTNLLWAFLSDRPLPEASGVDGLADLLSPLSGGVSLLELLIGGVAELLG